MNEAFSFNENHDACMPVTQAIERLGKAVRNRCRLLRPEGARRLPECPCHEGNQARSIVHSSGCWFIRENSLT